MKILSLHPKIKEYLEKRKLEKKFEKQKNLFEQNPFLPELRNRIT